MLGCRSTLLLTLFAFSYGIDLRISQKDAIIKYWKERTLYNFISIVSTDLMKYASSSDRALFKGCLTYSGTDTDIYQYSRCLGPLIRKTKGRSNRNIVNSPKRMKYGSKSRKSASIDLNSYRIASNNSPSSVSNFVRSLCT